MVCKQTQNCDCNCDVDATQCCDFDSRDFEWQSNAKCPYAHFNGLGSPTSRLNENANSRSNALQMSAKEPFKSHCKSESKSLSNFAAMEKHEQNQQQQNTIAVADDEFEFVGCCSASPVHSADTCYTCHSHCYSNHGARTSTPTTTNLERKCNNCAVNVSKSGHKSKSKSKSNSNSSSNTSPTHRGRNTAQGEAQLSANPTQCCHSSVQTNEAAERDHSVASRRRPNLGAHNNVNINKHHQQQQQHQHHHIKTDYHCSNRAHQKRQLNLKHQSHKNHNNHNSQNDNIKLGLDHMDWRSLAKGLASPLEPATRHSNHYQLNEPHESAAEQVQRYNSSLSQSSTNLTANSDMSHDHKATATSSSFTSRAASKSTSCGWSACNAMARCFVTMFPIVTTFKHYNVRNDLLGDLIAGITVAVLQIPQGMAYGLLAGVEPVYGLYVSLVPVLVMAIMSKSRHVSYGTFAITSMIMASSLESTKHALKMQYSQIIDSTPNSAATINTQQASFLKRNSIAQPSHGLAHAFDASSRASGDEQLWQDTKIANTVAYFVMPTNIEILTCMCILVGAIQIIMSMLRLGILSLMFNDQLVSSFTTASAVHVATSQLGSLVDLPQSHIPEGPFKVCRTWWSFLDQLIYHTFNPYTALLSILSVLFLLGFKELFEPWLRSKLIRRMYLPCLPSELVLLVVVTFSSWLWSFESSLNIKIVGVIPTGLPEAKLPRFEIAPLLINDALTVAIVSFAMNYSLAQVYAKRYKYKLDANQELFALGSSNVVGSFFQCYACSSSLSRSAVQSSLNPKSQICAITSCVIVVTIVCYLAPILHDSPTSTLSCIIIVALKGILLQIRDLFDTWRLSKLDALNWFVTFTSVIAFGVTLGLVLGLISSLVMVFFRVLLPKHSILGLLPGTDAYVDVCSYADCKEMDQVKIFRFNSPLCYLNVAMFRAQLQGLILKTVKSGAVGANEAHLDAIWSHSLGQHKHNSMLNSRQTSSRVRFVVVDCSTFAYCDQTAASCLAEIIDEFKELKINILLAGCQPKLLNMIERTQKIEATNLFRYVGEAVRYAKYNLSRDTRSVEASTPQVLIQ